jgi:HNH endonuclease
MLDVLLRTALWEAHNHLCVYCGQLVPFSEMQADHIVPAVLQSNEAERTRVLEGPGLHASADLDEIWNRVPSHRRCNRAKSDNLLNDGSIRFFLDVAARAESKVTHEVERLRRRNREDRLKAAIAIAVVSGETSVADLIRAAVNSGSEPTLIAKMQTGDSASSLIKSVAGGVPISSLLALPILPRKHGLDELTMVKDKERVAVLNCADWAKYRRAGFYAATTYDIKEEAFFSDAYATLRALEVATPSATSFIGPIHFTSEFAGVFPASLLPRLSPDDGILVTRWIAEGVSLLDLSRNNGVILGEHQGALTITWESMTAYVSEILRADLDGDGIEDILYSYYSRVHQGTFGAGRVGVLTRRSDTALMEELMVDSMSQ